ncbi:hypothetical protein P0082_11595 [Candidatus Haliotispira prima]|uniref:Uncharacterized protein n=1 Tax=Candidatus Haliotispira prima TaxID=3034016 RepID=A0ABY8MGK4_9SPIO|nr:hypothetical protein P0082_11595 [Candidatus Haliotispira prima]
MVLSGCAPLSETNDPPDPTKTFTISFTGIQAVELTINLMEDMSVSAIVRLADGPAPAQSPPRYIRCAPFADMRYARLHNWF